MGDGVVDVLEIILIGAEDGFEFLEIILTGVVGA